MVIAVARWAPVPEMPMANNQMALASSNRAAGMGCSSSHTIEMGRSPSAETRDLAGPRKTKGAVSVSIRFSRRAKKRMV